MGEDRILFMVFRGQARVVDQGRDVPVRIAPIPVVKSASILNQALRHIQLRSKSEWDWQAINNNGNAAIPRNLLRMIFDYFRICFQVLRRFTVLLSQPRVNDEGVGKLRRSICKFGSSLFIATRPAWPNVSSSVIAQGGTWVTKVSQFICVIKGRPMVVLFRRRGHDFPSVWV